MVISRKALDLSDTIFALASGTLPSAVAIIRISGPLSFSIAEKIFKSKRKNFDSRAGMWFGKFYDESRFIDDGILLAFTGPHSQTGQDVIEIQCHGSPAIVNEIERTLLKLGARPSERGEFSYRAFSNQKISALELENLGDVFLARQSVDLDRIYQRKDESTSQLIFGLREALIRIQAILETAIDFSEEYSTVLSQVEVPLNAAAQECTKIISRHEVFVSGKTVPRVVLAGKPNAGKSSLFNALLCRYRAIVHELPGTTRDVIEEDFEVNKKTFKLVDTAGARLTNGLLEAEGIALGENYLAASAFWLLVVDGSLGLTETERRILKKFNSTPHLIIWNKMDLSGCVPLPKGCIAVSARTGQNMELVIEELGKSLDRLSLEDAGPLPTSVQCSRLKVIKGDLEELRGLLKNGAPPEILAEKNHGILQKVEKIIGPVETDEILDRIFRDFCIGK